MLWWTQGHFGIAVMCVDQSIFVTKVSQSCDMRTCTGALGICQIPSFVHGCPEGFWNTDETCCQLLSTCIPLTVWSAYFWNVASLLDGIEYPHLCRSLSSSRRHIKARCHFSLTWAFATFTSDLFSFHDSHFAFHQFYKMPFNHFIHDTQLRNRFRSA